MSQTRKNMRMYVLLLKDTYIRAKSSKKLSSQNAALFNARSSCVFTNHTG
jgi:hypothetical protein